MKFRFIWSGFKIFMTYSPVTFLREAFDELKKVTWPTRDDVVRLTFTVIVISTLVAIFLGSIDFGLEKLIARLIGN